METGDAFAALAGFSGADLTRTLSGIEAALVGATADTCDELLLANNAEHDVLAAAGLVKRLAGQINVIIHALGIMLCLPHILEPGEVIESASLGAGNTGRMFDLETSQRIAEFKFITWRGADAIRQNSLFKDFYSLAEYETSKSKYLYILGADIPLRFLTGGRAIKSVLAKDVSVLADFRSKYPECHVVREYYLPRRQQVNIVDVSEILSELEDVERAQRGVRVNDADPNQKTRVLAADLTQPVTDIRGDGIGMYWVYENWVAEKKAVVHRADCGFCRDGQGSHPNKLGNKNGCWHGPFADYQSAYDAAVNLEDRVVRDCARCI